MTKIFAHRGASKNYPENTMLAFAKAVECGCDGIELDVQLTADGQVVVIHDEKIDRTTDGHGNVRDMTLDELRRYNACGTRAESFAVQTIPTLREYFEYMQDKRQITNIELKNSIFDYPGMEEKVLMLAKEYRLTDRLQFSSFNHYSMQRCKQLAPEIPTGLLTSSWLVNAGAYGRGVGADFINARYNFLTAECVGEIKHNQLDCNAWTVDTPADILRLAGLDIASVITNLPDQAIALLR